MKRKGKVKVLNNPTMEKLDGLKLVGMLKAFREQEGMPEIGSLSFEERFGLMLDREAMERDNRKLKSRLKKAKLKLNACVEDIDYSHRRGLDKSVMAQLISCKWVRDKNNVIIIGPTGTGKSYLAEALANNACREGFDAMLERFPKLMKELEIAENDGRYSRLMKAIAKTALLVIDDFGLDTLTPRQRRNLLEVLEDRYNVRSIIVTSQFPVDKWHGIIGDPTLADAILDRLVHNSYKITLKGDSMRKTKRNLTENDR